MFGSFVSAILSTRSGRILLGRGSLQPVLDVSHCLRGSLEQYKVDRTALSFGFILW
ncbi:hypothetical protein AXX17_AT3G32580 [Arabidopsis thaliana]|uniref:Uncharacterized protein n=1 Tax=Arabidopsis thaliana TaxID=3702 RepID=A0A178VMF1_ARATH|nr:hypothetical protein AXX17_AT3G32580 [Arabidopsis thaliana]